MGNPDDRDHFDDYREQTRVKHEILAAYLLPYFQIVGKSREFLLYIDGFAGRGTYTKASTGEVFDGSPLRALRLIASNEKLSQKVRTLFIEWDKDLYEPLQQAVAEFTKANPQIREPWTYSGTFAEGVAELLRQAGGTLPPTFLFVDPCGVSGTNFDTIKSVMARRSSEAFIFFNIAAVKRIAGLKETGKTLMELFGSKHRAENLVAALRETSDADGAKRERMILEHYRAALREDMDVTFTIPFRVESEEKRTTSHYFVHATKHRLGFALMKDIMWTRGHSEEGLGALGFAQASRTDYVPLFDPQYDFKQTILKALSDGPKCVDLFYFDWVWRPEDVLCESAYKELLKQLEASGDIEVLDKDGTTPKPAATRIRKGKVTLGKGHFVRLATKPTTT